MKVVKLTEGLKLIEAGITALENIDSDEQSVATTRKSLENSFCCFKEVQTSLARIFYMLRYSYGVPRRTIKIKLTTY